MVKKLIMNAMDYSECFDGRGQDAALLCDM